MVTITSLACKSYTIKHKRMTVRAVTAMVAAGTSISSACNLASVERRLFYRWKRVVQGEKDTHPKKAKAAQATSVSAITAPVDQDMNPGTIITGKHPQYCLPCLPSCCSGISGLFTMAGSASLPL